MYQPRMLQTSGPGAFSATQYIEGFFSGAGTMAFGQPVCVDTTEAGEDNSIYTKAGGITAGTYNNLPTCGAFCRSTNSLAGPNLLCVGIYQPLNTNGSSTATTAPNFSIIRIQIFGRGVVSAQSPAGGSAGKTDGIIIASATVADAVPGAASYGLTIGILLATGAVITTNTQLFAAAGAVQGFYNAFIRPA